MHSPKSPLRSRGMMFPRFRIYTRYSAVYLMRLALQGLQHAEGILLIYGLAKYFAIIYNNSGSMSKGSS